MLLKLNGHISNCLERAADAEQRALKATDPAIRSDNEMLAASWRHLSRSYQFVESLERFLSDTGRNKQEVLPPDIRAIVEEQPAPPEGKPIIRRKRVKHTITFKDRLLKNAQEARARAARMPAGSERDQLLMQARQSETAADIDRWISSPGAPPPENLGLAKKPKA